MATQTTNYGLVKPSYGDNADIAVINSNMDKIDAKMKEIEDAGGGGASTWGEVAEKPFETVGSGLSVDENGALNVTGGGSGSSVEWNQIQTSGAKIAEVTIDGTKKDVYAPTGGSGGGGGRTKQTLYTNSTKSVQSIELSDSYKNYDLLIFRMIRIADSIDNYQDEKYYDKDFLESCQTNNCYFQFFAYNQWITYRITDETHFALVNNASGVYVKEVIGVNF